MTAFEEDLSRAIRLWKYGTKFDKLHWHVRCPLRKSVGQRYGLANNLVDNSSHRTTMQIVRGT